MFLVRPLNITLEISLTMRKEGIREMIESLRESKRRLPKKVRLAVMVFPRDQDDRDICVYISDQKLNIAYHMIEKSCPSSAQNRQANDAKVGSRVRPRSPLPILTADDALEPLLTCCPINKVRVCPIRVVMTSIMASPKRKVAECTLSKIRIRLLYR